MWGTQNEGTNDLLTIHYITIYVIFIAIYGKIRFDLTRPPLRNGSGIGRTL